MICQLCLKLFEELCKTKGRNNPELCQIYEDYYNGKIEGEEPLNRVIELLGEEEVERVGQKVLEKMKAGPEKPEPAPEE